MDRERVALEGCYDLQLSVNGLLDCIGVLSPVELATARCDPDGPPSLHAVARRLDDFQARLDALRRSLRGPGAGDLQARLVLFGGSPRDN